MAKRYEVRSSISRHTAEELINRLANDETFRKRFEANPRTVLFEHRIDVTPESLPEKVTLPPADKIKELLPVATALVDETASPFGFLLLFIVFGAMPVVTVARPAGDAAG